MTPEYPSIQRSIQAVRAAPHGQKIIRQRKLVRQRLASLKREIRAASALRAPGNPASKRSA
jgi:hypothetical protein